LAKSDSSRRSAELTLSAKNNQQAIEQDGGFLM
jgi:hypothetical protein